MNMEAVMVEYNPLNSFAVQLINLLRASHVVKVTESPYDKKFVRRIQQAAKEPMTAMSREDLWK